jgi:energy-coupling factor transporter ATP-binding protein EcfA2
MSHFPSSNPFASRFIQPGAIPFAFDNDPQRNDVLIADFVEAFFDAEPKLVSLCGPHGSGKSTLLNSIIDLGKTNERVRCQRHWHYTFHSSTEVIVAGPIRREIQANDFNMVKRWLNQIQSLISCRKWKAYDLVTIDGFEQLPKALGSALLQMARLRKVYLIATLHREQSNLPVAFHLNTSQEIDTRCLEHLLKEHTSPSIRSNAAIRWKKLREQHPTDMREVLSGMYDWWEYDVVKPNPAQRT